MKKNVVVGTAGHIDHGKTVLIKALTGTNTDRFKEEQQRGITIDIGFAFLTLPNGTELGIIDVPGHEKFVKNMLAGVGGIDLAILVIAADEGVMPQTKEHLSICDLLQIQQGLVALTKIDLVDEEWQEMVTEDIRETLTRTFLQDAPIVPVSSKTGEGLDRLLAELENVAGQVQERRSDGIFCLPIDRVFTIKGFGTVVTGTLLSGIIKPEDVVEILPAQITTRVRHVHVHDTPVPTAYAGQRTALNLHGTEKSALTRGNVLSEPDLLKPTYMLDAHLSLLPSTARPLKNRARVRFHHGTSEILARIVLFDREELIPGESTYVQIRLEASTVAMARDRYIIRSYSPIVTIGGGEILYTQPKKHKRSSQILDRMRTLKEGTLEEILEVYIKQSGFQPITPRIISGMLAISHKNIVESLRQLIQNNHIINTTDQGIAVIHATHYRNLRTMLLQTLDDFHQKSPLKSGMAKEELRKRLPSDLSLQVFQQILDEQMADGQIYVEQNIVRKSTHLLQLSSSQSTIKHQIEDIYLSSRFQPPNRKDAIKTTEMSEKEHEEIFRLLVDEGTLIRIDNEIYYHKEVLEEITQQIIEHFKQHHEIAIGDVKNLFQISRKYAVPILAYLDAAGVTIRKGDVRVLRTKK
jgi:selenocysteine-specific elongation factor